MRLAVIEACREVAGPGVVHLVTRETGQAVRSALAQQVAALESGTVATLDFTGVGIVDFSCADECLAKLLTRLIAGEYGGKYLCLSGLGASQRENIHVALERKKLPALLVQEDATWDCLGTITPHLRETLALVMSRPGLSARELAGLLNLELTASSTRLGNLYRQRLVRRHERPIDEGGGREYVYQSLLTAVDAGAGSRG